MHSAGYPTKQCGHCDKTMVKSPKYSRAQWKDAYIVEDRGYSTPCWISTQRPNYWGYCVEYHDGQRMMAHRWHYRQIIGPIPEGLQLDHLCRVRSCVNPDHLEPVTPKENTRRALEWKRNNPQPALTRF
jgi:hypothetical protein